MADYVDRLLMQLLHNMITVNVAIAKFIIICSIQMVYNTLNICANCCIINLIRM